MTAEAAATHDRFADALGPRYQLEQELGRGAMATVYRAHDLRHGRPVALKVLAPELAAELGGERFLREIALCAGLHHPHILPLYDSGAAGGTLYYVMPLVEGETLRARLGRAGALALDEALRLAAEVAEALAYAHARGVVHRDVKPENVLLQDGHALLGDFGIAHALAPAGAGGGEGRLTRTGISLGTPAYMSPEQAAADPDVDGRSDVYSLGCVLYETLVGEPPFTGPNVQAVLLQRFTRPPPRASAKRPGLPRAVDALLLRALAPAPADRFPDARALVDALADARAGLARPAAGAAVAPAERSIAVLPFESLSADPTDEFFADGIAEDIINALAQVDGLRVAARTSAFAFKGRREDLRAVGERLGVATVLEGSVRRAGSRLRVTAQLIDVADGYHLWSERYDRELTDVFAIQDEIAAAIGRRLRLSLDRGTEAAAPPTRSLEAYELYLKGRALAYRRGRHLRESITCLERAVALDDDFAHAHAALAEALAFAGYHWVAPPHEVAPRAEAAATRAVALAPSLPEAHHALGVWGFLYGPDRPAAAAALTRALALNPHSTPIRCAHAYWRRAVAEHAWDEAVREGEAAAAADPLNAFAGAMHALLLALARRHDDAVAAGRAAVALDPDAYFPRLILQFALGWSGRHAEAVSAAYAGLGVSGRGPFPLSTLAAEYGRAGETARAEAVLGELAARAAHEYVPTGHLARATLGAGRVEEALARCHQALDDGDPHVRTELTLGRFVDWEPLVGHRDWPALRARIAAATGETTD